MLAVLLVRQLLESKLILRGRSHTQVEQDGLPKEYSLDDHEVRLMDS